MIVQGSHNSITQAFLNAIQIALRDAEFNNLMPDTHFESAIKHINNWIEKYPDTASKFSELISPETTDKFILRLKQFDNDAYETFVKLYPQLSSGGTFNPFGGIDVVELYEKVSSSLSKYGYDGIFLVYDEFSKYLEANIKIHLFLILKCSKTLQKNAIVQGENNFIYCLLHIRQLKIT